MTDVEVGGPLQGAAFISPIASVADGPLTTPQHHAAQYDDHSSQASSLSQTSHPAALKHSTSDVSHLAALAENAADLTPPSSNASVRPDDDQIRPHDMTKVLSVQAAAVPVKEETPARQNSRSPHSTSSHDGVAGSKRTATGEVKLSHKVDYTLPGTSKRAELGCMRASSAVSNASAGNVSEISSQLRTKLKYAMLKVQNGWQTRSLDEIESLASASPRSAVSGFQHVHDRANFASPRGLNPRLERKWSDSSSSESNPSESQGRGFEASGLQESRTGIGSRSLAPPADIKPGSRRRPTPNNGPPLSGITASPLFPRRLQPVRPSPTQRTPSQNAAMEADAVETLLFMASPNNSGYHPPSQASQESSLRSTLIAQTSPLRAQFSQTSMTSPKKVAFSEPGRLGPPLSREALIDHMLDTLPDDSEDELERSSAPTASTWAGVSQRLPR